MLRIEIAAELELGLELEWQRAHYFENDETDVFCFGCFHYVEKPTSLKPISVRFDLNTH